MVCVYNFISLFLAKKSAILAALICCYMNVSLTPIELNNTFEKYLTPVI